MPTPSILLIDDEVNLLIGLEAVMKRAGFRVYTASNGTQGLQTAQAYQPDIIVSDVMMPPPNGFELRRILSQSATTASIPFIFLTARTAPIDKIHGLESGGDDYVTKPFDRNELIARVQAVLRRQEIGRQKGYHERHE